MSVFTRRGFLIGTAAVASAGLAGCQTNQAPGPVAEAAPASPYGSVFASMYAPIEGEPFPIPAVEPYQFDAAYIRKQVPYQTAEPPGTIIVDPYAHYLYLVQENGMAMRYGVGVGRQGFGWSGDATIKDKQHWPDWYPPKEMIERQPELEPMLTDLRGGRGVAGGPTNPLGARALYLYQGNVDTLYRIHGTFEPWTIGKSVSSGCIRMINQDAIDLYQRVPMNTRVVVLGNDSPVA